jgi:hypothetical protein
VRVILASMLKRLQKLLIPCHENSFRPNFLEGFSAVIILVLIVLSFAVANIQSLVWIGSEWLVSSILPAVIVDLTNNERLGGELTTLKRNEILDEAARRKAEDMVKNGYFAHHSPTGISPWYWFDQVGYDFVYAGENLAVHFTESDDVVDAWMESPSHKANIMNGQYQEIGVGTAKGEYLGSPTVFVVQLFGTKKAKNVETTVISEEETAPVAIVEDDVQPNVLAATQQTLPESEQKIAEVSTSELSSEVIHDDDNNPPAANDLEGKSIGALSRLEVEEMNDPNEQFFIEYTDFASSSRAGIPALTERIDGDDTVFYSSTIERSALISSQWLKFVYGILTVIVIFSLAASLWTEWRSHHPVHIVYACGLMCIMMVLLYAHTELTGGVVIF